MASDLVMWLVALVWGAALAAGFVYGLVRQASPQTLPQKVRSWLPTSAIAGLGLLASLMSSGKGSWTTAFFCLLVLPPIGAFAMAVGRPASGNRLIDLIYGDRAERDRRARASTYRPVEFDSSPPSDLEGRGES